MIGVDMVFSYIGFGGCRGNGPGRLMNAEAAASEIDARCGSMGRGGRSAFTWVAILGHLGGRLVGPVDAFQRGRSDFASGQRPRMWCDIRGLRAVALSSMGCGQLGRAALLLERSGGTSGRRPRKVVPVDCAGRDGAVDVGWPFLCFCSPA